MRILVVEDKRKLAQALASALKAEHHEVVLAPTGEDGLFRANAESFDLVLLDLMLPGRNGLELDVMARRVTRGGHVVDVTAREFELLECLLRHQGHVVSREMLAHDVWKEPRRATPIDNMIDVQVARLRRKVDVDERERLIHTVRGVGFVRESEP